MNLNIVSDLHLDASNFVFNFNEKADVLILAGDLAVDLNLIESFFYYSVPKNIPVLYVLGNHEFDDKIFEQTAQTLKDKLIDFNHVKILNRESVIINDHVFIGATLWADLNHDKKMIEWSNLILNKVFTIKNEKLTRWNGNDMISEFEKDIDFIKKELEINEHMKKIVITHFSPSMRSIAKYFEKEENNRFWCTPLDDIVKKSDLWIHGHVHHGFDYEIEQARVVANPRGYSHLFNLHQNTNFDSSFSIDTDLQKKNKIKTKY